jgi:hypothetical protein
MITLLLALVVGLLLGALLAHRLFYAAATATSRRALDQLQGTLDGLESAYSMKVATFEAQCELTTLSALSGRDHQHLLTVHLPRPGHRDVAL